MNGAFNGSNIVQYGTAAERAALDTSLIKPLSEWYETDTGAYYKWFGSWVAWAQDKNSPSTSIPFSLSAGQSRTLSIPEGYVISSYGSVNTSGQISRIDVSGNILQQWQITGAKFTTPVMVGSQIYKIDCVSGVINLLIENSTVISSQLSMDSMSIKKGIVIKRFTDTRNVTLTNNAGMSSVVTIDQQSPFDGAAMKLVLTADNTSTRSFDVIMSNMNLPNFDSHVGISIWIDDPLKITQFTTYIGNTNLVAYNQYNRIVAAGGDKMGGWRVIEAGPVRTPAVNTFNFGVDSLQQVKFRISVVAGQTTTIWIKDMFTVAKQSPIIAFTYDDDYANWITRVIPHFDRNKIKGTFGVATANISAGTGGVYLTAAGVQSIISGGHQIGAHNVNNYKLQTLNASGNGENNGTGTSLDATGYATEYITAKAYLSSLGVPQNHFCYHPWVQGGMDNVGNAFIRSEGADLIRAIGDPSEVNLYGFQMGNNLSAIKAFELGNATSLAQAKAAVDQCVKYGGLLVFMGHNTADTATDSITWAESDLSALCDYVGAAVSKYQAEVMRMIDLRDRLLSIGALNYPSTNPKPVVRQIGRRLLADFNVTTDQQIFLVPGNYIITEIAFTKTTRSMTTAAGGVYTAASKGGTVILPASQTYTALTVATDVLMGTPSSSPTVTGSVYFSLTTAQGAAGTVDIFVFGYPV